MFFIILADVETQPADTEDIAEHARRVTKAEEQVVRSARTMYALSQQVTQFHDDLCRLNLRSADERKKVCMWMFFQHFLTDSLLRFAHDGVLYVQFSWLRL